MMTSKSKIKGIVVSHTHWDIEWYLPFEEYRAKLLMIMDKVIDLLENNPEFKHFTLDGQASPIEAYLEFRPEMEDKVRRLVAAGKLLLGPFYSQPDEALASSEALVRNLLIGHRTALKYGRVMKVGYLPDIFGHVPQLPQILRGFSIDSFIFSRGLGDEEDWLKPEFIYEAPDGSRVLARFLRRGYCNSNLLGLVDPYNRQGWESPTGWKTVFLNIYYHEPEPDFQAALEKVKELSKILEDTYTRVLLLMNGCDHMPPQAYIADIIRKLNETGEFELIHGTLEDYVKELRKHADKMQVYKGEMRGCKSRPILSSSISARMYIKQMNYQSQLLLEKYAEPLSLLASMHGYRYPRKRLLTAWKLVLLNHAHDSIYGTGTDPVHKENEVRFLRAIQIASDVAYEAARHLAERIADNPPSGAEYRVLVFNPLGWPRRDIATLVLPSAGFKLVDAEGREIPAQVVEYLGPWIGVKVAFPVEATPLGYTTLYLAEGEAEHPKEEKGTRIENDKVAVEAVGGKAVLKIFDKKIGLTYTVTLVDEGDAGDEYNYSPPQEHDPHYTSAEVDAETSIVAGKVMKQLVLKFEMNLPEKLEGQKRSQKLISNPVKLTATIYEWSPRVDLKIELENRAEDHRLRLKIQAPYSVDYHYAESQFYVIKRSVKIPEGKDWVEKPPTTFPQLGWMSIDNGEVGVTVANKGFPEYEVRNEEQGAAVYVTLLRAVGWLSRGDLVTRRGHAGPAIPTPDAQCKRKMTFELSIIPHKGDWKASKSYVEAGNFTAPLLSVYAPLNRGKAPATLKVASIDPPLVVTALKKAEDNEWSILRFYNVGSEETEAEIKIGLPFQEAWLANLNEEPLEKVRAENGLLRLKVQPHKIVTLMLKPPRGKH